MKRLIATAIVLIPCALGPLSCASTSTTPPEQENICDFWNDWTPDKREIFIGSIWSPIVPNVMTSLEKFELSGAQRTSIRECLVAGEEPLTQDVTTACARPGAFVNSAKIGEMAGERSGACVGKAF